MDQVGTIRLLHQELPKCPFIWTYNGFMFPIKSSQKVNLSDFDLTEEQHRFLSKYDCDCYMIEQYVINIDKHDITIANISFHSWLFTKIRVNSNEMTNQKLNLQIMSSLIPIGTDELEQNGKFGIEINSFGKRRVHTHNNRLSPKCDNSINLKNKPTDFFSICINEKTGQCCITKHKLFY